MQPPLLMILRLIQQPWGAIALPTSPTVKTQAEFNVLGNAGGFKANFISPVRRLR